MKKLKNRWDKKLLLTGKIIMDRVMYTDMKIGLQA